MSDFLQKMAASSAQRAQCAPRFAAADFDLPLVPLQLGSFDVIAEIKDRSPAEGELSGTNGDRCERARQYAAGGAAAISVLTEPTRFAGDLAHLKEVVAAVPDTPVMRKDFLVEPVQIEEARAAGAGGVLLIVTMLHDKLLRSMLDCAREHGLFVLLESFDEDDLQRLPGVLTTADKDAAERAQLLFGVNTRNLRTLEVDADRLQRFAGKLPQGRLVAESGLYSADDAARVAGYGYSLALVGTALMKSADPAALVRQMKTDGAAVLQA